MTAFKLKTLAPVLIAALVLSSWGCGENSGAAKNGRTAPLLEGMGDLHHPVTTKNKIAQRYFNQGLVLSYGFNHKEAERSFREAARLDPDCAMAWWGAALVIGPNINAAMEDTEVPNAYAAIQKALALAPKASEKERAYINALAKRYAAEPVENRKPLDEAYAAAMREVAQQYPEDADAAALAAEALMDLHPWDFWEKDGRPKSWTPEIIEVLEAALTRWPNHPGVNHFYIHTVEASKNPGRATAAADRLGDLVPGAGHLVHMPGHIYIRTGRYNEAVIANEKAIKADGDYITQCHAQGLYPVAYMPHNHHFLSASATMSGQSEKAIYAARYMAEHQDHDMMRQPGYGTLQHFTTIPLYSLAKFGRWEEILKEPAPAEDLRYPTGIWHYARGMAYTRTNRLKEAAQELEKLQTIAADTALKKVTIWDLNTTYQLLQIAREMLAGEMAAKQRDFNTAVGHLQKAVAMEDELTYDEPPPWYAPARHNLGAVLLEAGRAAEAEKVYREDLEKYPENGWSLSGLQQSLAAQGKSEEAKAVQARFEKAWASADVTLAGSRF
jgi:tetratricopeptide (TPR) repeat protein